MDKHLHNAQTVVAMSDYQPDTGYAAIAQVEAYWEAVRGTRLLPKRSDIDPRGIEQSLEHAFILERVTAGVARLRIAGNKLNELIGMEVRGMPLTSFFTPAARKTVSELLEDVFQRPAVCTLNLSSPAGPGRPAIKGRVILLPLKSDLGVVSRGLGCLVVKGAIGTAPRRFDIVSKTLLHITSSDISTPSPAVPAPVLPPQAPAEHEQISNREMAEPAEPFKPADDARRPPYLRLVKSDES